MKNHKRAWAEINLSRLENNINTIKSHISTHTDIMAVVKADAYGHGEKEILKKLNEIGIKYFAFTGTGKKININFSSGYKTAKANNKP